MDLASTLNNRNDKIAAKQQAVKVYGTVAKQ
jgi:hypothetical protein